MAETPEACMQKVQFPPCPAKDSEVANLLKDLAPPESYSWLKVDNSGQDELGDGWASFRVERSMF